MSALDWQVPNITKLNGIELAWWETGPKDSAYPPIIFSHGFPELAFSWRHQMEALGNAGFRCIAPDQRGYGYTHGPEDVEAYSMAHLCGDLDALCEHLEIESALFCGHDWGGLIIWQMPLRHPTRTAGVISLNTPYTKRAPMEPIALYRKRFGDDFYIVWFQEPLLAEQLLEEDIRKTLTYFAQTPEVKTGGDVDTRQGSSLKDTLAGFNPKDARPLVMSESDFDYYVQRFEATGFGGGINWYRNFTPNWHDSEGQVDLVHQPGLMICAELDAVLPPEASFGMEKYVPDLERVIVKGSGHWTQQEKPDAVNSAIFDWITKRF